MFYIFFAFFFSFMLCASENVEVIEGIIHRETLHVLYIDDSVVNLKMTEKQVKIYNAENASPQIILTIRGHGNNLMREELATQHMVWCDIQMSPYLKGDVVLANLRIQHPDFEHPPFIAVTGEKEFHDSDEELSQHARDRHFIAGRDKIKTPDDIRVVLGVYYSWLEKQKEQTYISRIEEEFTEDQEGAIRKKSHIEWILSDVDDGHHGEICDISESEKESDDDSEHISKKQKPDPSLQSTQKKQIQQLR
jgi:CheY-like chemotaxis protein